MTLLASYKMRDGEGVSIFDDSGNGNDATLSTSDSTAFWSAAKEVSGSLIAAEAVQGSTVYTDGQVIGFYLLNQSGKLIPPSTTTTNITSASVINLSI